MFRNNFVCWVSSGGVAFLKNKKVVKFNRVPGGVVFGFDRFGFYGSGLW